jgi:hypothetical protein
MNWEDKSSMNFICKTHRSIIAETLYFARDSKKKAETKKAEALKAEALKRRLIAERIKSIKELAHYVLVVNRRKERKGGHFFLYVSVKDLLKEIASEGGDEYKILMLELKYASSSEELYVNLTSKLIQMLNEKEQFAHAKVS